MGYRGDSLKYNRERDKFTEDFGAFFKTKEQSTMF